MKLHLPEASFCIIESKVSGKRKIEYPIAYQLYCELE